MLDVTIVLEIFRIIYIGGELCLDYSILHHQTWKNFTGWGIRLRYTVITIISGERIRDWLKGTVVQVDPKMIAVQFQENVYLTDGWMVPDHVLWCPKGRFTSENRIRRRRKRPTGGKIVHPSMITEYDEE